MAQQVFSYPCGTLEVNAPQEGIFCGLTWPASGDPIASEDEDGGFIARRVPAGIPLHFEFELVFSGGDANLEVILQYQDDQDNIFELARASNVNVVGGTTATVIFDGALAASIGGINLSAYVFFNSGTTATISDGALTIGTDCLVFVQGPYDSASTLEVLTTPADDTLVVYEIGTNKQYVYSLPSLTLQSTETFTLANWDSGDPTAPFLRARVLADDGYVYAGVGPEGGQKWVRRLLTGATETEEIASWSDLHSSHNFGTMGTDGKAWVGGRVIDAGSAHYQKGVIYSVVPSTGARTLEYVDSGDYWFEPTTATSDGAIWGWRTDPDTFEQRVFRFHDGAVVVSTLAFNSADPGGGMFQCGTNIRFNDGEGGGWYMAPDTSMDHFECLDGFEFFLGRNGPNTSPPFLFKNPNDNLWKLDCVVEAVTRWYVGYVGMQPA